MRIVELIIDEEAELYGIDAISIVDRPAIELDFIALKEQKLAFAEADADKRILLGPALVPDKPIYRRNGDDEFYVYFSKGTVRKASELYLKHGNQANHTLEHDSTTVRPLILCSCSRVWLAWLPCLRYNSDALRTVPFEK